jgi:tetrahydromethanopterin S-methyltransferase subunit E
MRDFIKRALTRRIPVKGRRKQIELEPSTKLVYGMYFAMVALGGLVALEFGHMAFLGSWNSEIFAAISGLIGTIVGVFITAKI